MTTSQGVDLKGRITPREVLEAYRNTCLLPATDEYFEEGEYAIGGYACPIAAISAAHGVTTDKDIREYLAQRLGVAGDEYDYGFTLGFDGCELREYEPRDDHRDDEGLEWWYRAGYRDGQRCRRFVLPEDSRR